MLLRSHVLQRLRTQEDRLPVNECTAARDRQPARLADLAVLNAQRLDVGVMSVGVAHALLFVVVRVRLALAAQAVAIRRPTSVGGQRLAGRDAGAAEPVAFGDVREADTAQVVPARRWPGYGNE